MTDHGNSDVCQTTCRHEDTVRRVESGMLSSDILMDLSELFKVLGDHTRVRIIHALSFSELCVCDLAEIIKMSSSAISHQLRVLRAAKLVKFRKDGKKVFYSLDDEHVFSLLSEGLDHVREGR